MARVVACVVLVTTVGACTDETATPVDFDAVTTTSVADPAAGETVDDPNAEARAEVDRLAREQCLDDPELEVGTVRIVDPTTDEVVSEYVVDCAEVRADDEP